MTTTSHHTRAWHAMLALTACAGQPANEVAAHAHPPAVDMARTASPVATSVAYAACTRAYNERRWHQLRACYAKDVVQDEPGTGKPWVGVDDAIDHLRLFVESFPDNTSVPELTLINGNQIVSIVLVRGTNDGPFPNTAGPTHESIGLTMAHLVELDADAKVKTEWILYDTLTMFSQLKLIPGAGRSRIAAASTPAQIVEAKGDATEERNLADYRAAVDAFNRHDIDALSGCLAEDLVWIEPSRPEDLGKPAVLAAAAELWSRFSDLRRTPTTIWAAGDYVVATGLMTGTNDGAAPARGIARTGKAVSATFIEIAHFTANKRDRSWLFYNGIVIAAQLGIL